jgi:hypothetical protein
MLHVTEIAVALRLPVSLVRPRPTSAIQVVFTKELDRARNVSEPSTRARQVQSLGRLGCLGHLWVSLRICC